MRVLTYLLLPFLSDATNGAGTCVTCTVVATWISKLIMYIFDGQPADVDGVRFERMSF